MMNATTPVRAYLVVWAATVLLQPANAVAQQNSEPSIPSAQSAHDEQHDFDFELGTWKIHLKRLQHPLSGSKNWIEFDGTSVTRKVWDGRAEIEEFETDGAAG